MAQPTLLLEVQTERAWTAQVIQVAHLHGWLVAHFRPARRADGSWMTPLQADGAGFPDLVLTRSRGEQVARLLFVELKTERGRLAPLQRRWLEALEATSAECYVWRPHDWAEVVEVLA